MAWNFPKLSRRTFLKSTGAGAAGLTLLKTNTLLSQQSLKNVDKEDVSYTICNFCSSLCNVKVTSRTTNGVKRIVKLDGNPHSTLNRGKLCARGQAGIRQTYDTDRFKKPLIRVEGSKRGEWNFREASWEEAWEYIAKKNKSADIQPWEWTLIGGWTSCIFYMNWSVPFAVCNGIPNIVASPMQHCVTTGHLGTDSVPGNFNVHDEILPDYDNAKYIIYVANNSSIAGVSTSRAVRFTQGKKNGAKVVVLDPRVSETGAKADERVAIRPGTDLDFCLAMLREMLDKKMYDAEFLRIHSNMPFLVYKGDGGKWHIAKNEKGHFVTIRDGSQDYHIVPAYTNNNRPNVNGEKFCSALYAPEGTIIPEGFEGAGKPAVTVLQAQLEDINHCTPEWAEKTTGIAAERILRITHEFATTRPSLIDPGWHGARFANVMMVRRVQAMIQALNGGIDKKGGWIMSGEFHHKLAKQVEAKQKGQTLGAPMATYTGMDFALFVVKAFSSGETFQPHGRPGWAWVYSAQQKAEGKQGVALPVLADEGLKESVEGKVKWKGKPYLTKAFFINAANPVRHYYPDTYWKDIMASDKIELVVALDVLPSDTTPYADVILPHSTYLERYEPTVYGNGVNQDLAMTTRYAAIDPLYDSREIPDILLKFTEIFGGKETAFDKLSGTMEALAGLPAAPTKAAWERFKKDPKEKNPFTAACREVAFVEAAKKVHTTVEEFDRVLREKGIYHEESWEDILKHQGMPRKLPTPTASGRIEFYSSLFDMLGGNKPGALPHFSVLATHIAAECRKGKTMDQPLDKDEFYFAYGKVPTVSYASTNSNNPVLAAINIFKKDIYTGVWMHPDRAAQLGLQTGDKINLTNTLSGQQADGRTYVTRLVRSDTLFIPSAFGVENPQLTRSYAMGGTATNKLIPHNVEPVVAGFRSQEFTLRVAKA